MPWSGRVGRSSNCDFVLSKEPFMVTCYVTQRPKADCDDTVHESELRKQSIHGKQCAEILINSPDMWI